MTTATDPYNTNLAAEFYVLSMLHRWGADAVLTLGNKKAVDILVTRAAGRSEPRRAAKTARGALLLATRGYVEDASILARSLASLAIDLSYLSAGDHDRFLSYEATGRVARRRMAQTAGFAPLDEATTDWSDAKARSAQWQKPGAIAHRATKSGCADLYERAYRHGSSYEHSDAWSLLTFEANQAAARDVVLHLALLVIAYSLVKAYHAWSEFLGDQTPRIEQAIKDHFLDAFPRRAR